MKPSRCFRLAVILLLLTTAGTLRAAVTLTTPAVAAANIYQGTTNNIVYAVKMDVTVSAVTVNNIQFTLSGNHDANDLTSVNVYFNASAVSLSGASYLGNAVATFAAPNTYSININKPMAAATSGYFIITVNVSESASDNKTVRITGGTTPVTFGFTSAVSVTNNQTNNAGTQTIQAPDVTLTSTAVAADTIYQNTTNNVVYIVKMDVATANVTVNNIQFTLSGNHDADDLTYVNVYFNPSAASMTGASYLGNDEAGFAAPNAYNININRPMTAGTSGYFLITVNVSATATDNKTVRITGSTTPVVFGYTTAPNVTNGQTNNAGTQSIQAADITLTSTALATDTIYQNTTNNVVYIVKMDVATANVTANNIQFTLIGNHDADDLTYVNVYFNPSAASMTGASYLGNAEAGYAAPNAYSININRPMTAGTSGYFLITVNVSATATDNKTVRITGGTTPVVFGYTTAPNVTNGQTNNAGAQSIQVPDINLTTSAVAAGTIFQNTTNNVVYIVKMDVATANVTVNKIQFTLGGTHDANDLTYVNVYFNPSAASMTGASYLGNAEAGYAGPKAYSININRPMTAGTSGYFLVTVNVNATASDNKTVGINGSTTPVVFGYTTAPKVTNSQTNTAGVQTIQAPDINLTSSAVAAGTIFQNTTNNVVYIVKMDVTTANVTVNKIQFILGGTHDANDLTYVNVYFNPSAASMTGASYLGNAEAKYAGPKAYSININRPMTAGTSGYFLVTANVNATASDNKTVSINGSTTPVVFGYTTAPNVTNSQTNAAGVQTIQAPDITLTTSAVAAGNIVRGSTNNVVYIAKMDVITANVTVNNIQFTLSGTHDADDLTYVNVYFNASAASMTGASYLGNAEAGYAAPKAYSININRPMTAGTSGYFLVTVNVNAAASTGKTVQVNGATTPVVFGYTTAPNVTNSQTNSAGVKTITAAFAAVQSAGDNSSAKSGQQPVVAKLYPNPASSVLTVEFTAATQQRMVLQLTDASGNAAFTRKLETVMGFNRLTTDVHNLAAGFYHLRLVSENGTIMLDKKLIISH